jgi:hypothetical protein
MVLMFIGLLLTPPQETAAPLLCFQVLKPLATCNSRLTVNSHDIKSLQ